MWKCVLGYGNIHFWLCKNTGTMKRIHVFNNVEMRFGLCQDTGAMNRSPTPDGMFTTNFVGVRHVIGSLSAAVGADLSRPHIRKHTRNGKRKYRFDDVKHTCAMTNICVFDNVNTRIW